MPLAVTRSVSGMLRLSRAWRKRGESVAFVPTMGALHEGHAALIRGARKEHARVIVSVFVNPTQFGPREDFTRYPRNLRRDRAIITAAGADALFAPDTATMYPSGFQTRIEAGPVSRRWEGECRPGHFDGVATVVGQLLHITEPDVLYLGQKDYQQVCVLRRMIEDLHVPVSVRMRPTVRERDGLAMSSRNAYLSPSERQRAAGLYAALKAAAAEIRAGERRGAAISQELRRRLQAIPARVDYAAAADAATLEPLARVKGKVALLAAIRLGPTRLIDNLLLNVS